MPLTVQYCSDLHLEFERNRKWISKYPLEVKGDILLLAGDITPFAQLEQHNAFFDYVSSHFKATYWIPGNHEYYGADITRRSGTLQEVIRDNVFLVNNTTVTIEDTILICSTLWSHIDAASEWEIRRAMSDFHVIKSGSGILSVEEYNRLHMESRLYLEQALATNNAAHTIVMTHHVPTMMNYPAKYKGNALNSAFAVELHDLIESSGADCWIYGHTHANTPDFKIGNTHMLTNQLGYVQYGENKHFNRAKTFSLR